MKVEITIEQAEQILKHSNSEVIREALVNQLKLEKRRIEVELAKIVLMQDAEERGDFEYISDKLRQEMESIVRKKEPLLLTA